MCVIFPLEATNFIRAVHEPGQYYGSGRARSGRVSATKPDPCFLTTSPIRSDPTRPDPTRPVRFRMHPDPTGLDPPAFSKPPDPTRAGRWSRPAKPPEFCHSPISSDRRCNNQFSPSIFPSDAPLGFQLKKGSCTR